MIGILAGVGMEALELFITQPSLVALTGQQPDLSDLAGAKGNWRLYGLLLAATWTLAALGEELVWRGHLLSRAALLLGKSRSAWAVGMVAMSLMFGLAHSGQGVTGVIENTLNGLLLGGLYLVSGRNLLAPVLAHGITDTVDSTLIFAGLYPGL